MEEKKIFSKKNIFIEIFDQIRLINDREVLEARKKNNRFKYKKNSAVYEEAENIFFERYQARAYTNWESFRKCR